MSEDVLEWAKALVNSPFGTHKQAIDVIHELIAEVEANRALIEWTAKNFLDLESGLSWGGGIDAAMKSTVEEVKRLRSQSVEQVFRRKNEEIAALGAKIKTLQSRLAASNKGLVDAIEAKELALAEMRSYHRAWEKAEARIKELEEMIRQLGSLAFMGDMPLDQIVAHFIAWGQSNYDYTSRLEAAFLELHEHVHGDPLEAREALERIRNGE